MFPPTRSGCGRGKKPGIPKSRMSQWGWKRHAGASHWGWAGNHRQSLECTVTWSQVTRLTSVYSCSVLFQDGTMSHVSMWSLAFMCLLVCTQGDGVSGSFCLLRLRCLHVCMPTALLPSCLSSSKTCCEQLTNCHGTVPSTPVTDVSAGWWLMKISWKTSIGLSSGGLPGFIMPAFVPEVTGSTLSASTDPSKCKGLTKQWAEGSLFIRLVCYWHIFSGSKLAAHCRYWFSP